MRKLAFSMLACCACFAWGDEPEARGVRNPFWPDGYDGVREAISPEVRAKKETRTDAEAVRQKAEEDRLAAEAARKAAEVALEKAKSVAAPPPPKAPPTSANDEWRRAQKALRIGNPASVTDAAGVVRTSVNINGTIYVDGDLVSVTVDGICYTWRLQGQGTKSIKLVRVRATPESELRKKGKRK